MPVDDRHPAPRGPRLVVLLELVICHLLAALLVWAAAPVLGLARCHVLLSWSAIAGVFVGLLCGGLERRAS